MKNNYRNLSVLCFSALLLGTLSFSAARADYDDYSGKLPTHIRKDIERIHRDERNLESLEDERDEARRCHNYDDARDIELRIRSLRKLIGDEKRDVKKDIDKLRREERDRDNYRNNHNEDYSYRDDYSSGRKASKPPRHIYVPESNGRRSPSSDRRNSDNRSDNRRSSNTDRDSYRNRDDN